MEIRFYGLFAILFSVLSIAAFVLYGHDKALARRRAHRIPERVLLSLGFFGGALGALLGMQAFRHKTKHTYFYVINVCGLLLQLALEGYLLYLGI